MAKTTREDQRHQGAAWRARLGQPNSDAGLAAPGYRDLVDEMVYHGVWAREGLAPTDRMIVTLAVLSLSPIELSLRRTIGAALDLGLEPRTILEVFIQTGLYGGFPPTEAAIECAGEVFGDRGVSAPDDPPRDDSLEELDERGRSVMAALHGERRESGYAAPDNPVTSVLYEAAIRYGYGEIWTRPGLELRQRMLIAIASFVALRLDSQIRKFGESAINAGLGRDEVVEAVIQTAPYSGYPQALNALAILSDVSQFSPDSA